MEIGEESICFNQELGLATTLWARVETSILVAMFPLFTKRQHRRLAMGFLSIENFRSKLAFADAIMEDGLQKKPRLAKRWAEISQRLTSASEKRNKLAHNRCYVYPNEVPGRRLALASWKMSKEPHPTGKPPPGSYCVRDIVGIKHEFFALIVTLSNFEDRLERRKVSSPVAHEQPVPIPDLQTLSNQIHAALGHPRLSAREKRQLEDANNAAASLKEPKNGKGN